MKNRIKLLLIILIVLLTNKTTIAQTKDSIQLYKDAFAEQLKMLKGEQIISFKRAVFLTENAFYNGKLNYTDFCKEIFNNRTTT